MLKMLNSTITINGLKNLFGISKNFCNFCYVLLNLQAPLKINKNIFRNEYYKTSLIEPNYRPPQFKLKKSIQ